MCGALMHDEHDRPMVGFGDASSGAYGDVALLVIIISCNTDGAATNVFIEGAHIIAEDQAIGSPIDECQTVAVT